MSVVQLNKYEMLQAAHVGSMRRLSAIKRSRQDHYGKPAFNLWGMDIESAGAECAFAKHMGIYWQSLADDPRTLDGDVGGYEVRHTARPDGRLIVHPPDSDDAPFALVTGTMPRYKMHGWIMGSAAKQQRYWFEGDGRPAYFVPQRDLLPLDQEPMEVAA